MSAETSDSPKETGEAPNPNPQAQDNSRRPSLFILLSVAMVVLIADQLTKLAVVSWMPLYDVKPVIPGFFNLVHVRNTGAAFSFLAGDLTLWRQVFFIAVTLFAIGIIFYIHGSFKEEDRLARGALGLILGGAAGNLVDRVRLGEVIDFLDFYAGAYHWPAFNVADSCITVGCLILLGALLRRP